MGIALVCAGIAITRGLEDRRSPSFKAEPVFRVGPKDLASPNVELIVSNQSDVDRNVDIKVELNGKNVADGDFPVGDSHLYVQFPVQMSESPCKIVATSSFCKLPTTTEFELVDKVWVVVTFHRESKDVDVGELRIDVRNRPLGIR